MRATLILLYCIFVSNVFCQVTHEWNFTTPGNDEDRVTDLAITFDDNLLFAGWSFLMQIILPLEKFQPLYPWLVPLENFYGL